MIIKPTEDSLNQDFGEYLLQQTESNLMRVKSAASITLTNK